MARVNIYLTDDLASRAREAGLNVSAIAREALERELRVNATNEWLALVAELPRGRPISNPDLMRIMDEVREEFGRAADKHLGDPDRTYP